MSSLMRPCADQEQDHEAAAAAAASSKTTAMPLLFSSDPSMLFLLPGQQRQQQLHHTSSSRPAVGLNPEVNCITGAFLPLASSHDADGQESSSSSMIESWRQQLLLGGLVGDHEKYSTETALLSKGLDEGPTPHEAAAAAAAAAAYDFHGHGAGGDRLEMQTTSEANKSQLSQMLPASSPRSCITTSLGSNMHLDFSNFTAPAAPAPELTRNHHQSDSSECNSTATASALKKARVQASSSAQSTLKVRKERLGDRITSLHQIVSPFGKTDTASVLQETIGYIRFLLGQIEALSYPYLGHCSGKNLTQQQTGLMAGSERSTTTAGLFPEFPAQQQQDAEKDNGGMCSNKQAKRDLRSRGLCLVPLSCTSHLAADNDVVLVGSDLWAAPAAAALPAPLGGIIQLR